jgi:hypothetical protein
MKKQGGLGGAAGKRRIEQNQFDLTNNPYGKYSKKPDNYRLHKKNLNNLSMSIPSQNQYELY